MRRTMIDRLCLGLMLVALAIPGAALAERSADPDALLGDVAACSVAYPHKGAFPTPMGSGYYLIKGLNSDGTSAANPVIDTGTTVTADGVTYLLKRLAKSNSITFNGKNYVVYSAVDRTMTIDYAYKNIRSYYAGTALTGLDFVMPTTTLNGGQATTLGTKTTRSPYTGETVVLTAVTGTGAGSSKFFIPNLPNPSGGHTGLTGNLYWTIDPYKGQAGCQPNGPVYHLCPYGWALDSRSVNDEIFLYNLCKDGGNLTAPATTSLLAPTPPFNTWVHLIEGKDSAGNGFRKGLITAVEKDTQYPFPNPAWLQNGMYFPIQPMPGFQRNGIRWYSAWGSCNLLNNTSGLYVRQDGTVEIPVQVSANGTYSPYPLVRQTWDGTQRYSVLNLTAQVIPSSYDVYPGAEVYLAANAYLPGKAGVLSSYDDYRIYDGTATLNPREPDIWLGFLGDRPSDIMLWADAKTDVMKPGTWTEPGGQGNKPYMMGATTVTVNGTETYYCRLQSSNSFFIARLSQASVRNKFYKASFYLDSGTGHGYQLVATLSYAWQPWTIDASGKWAASSDGLGAGVPSITVSNDNAGVDIKVSTGTNWNSTGRVMGWTERSWQQGDKNALGAAPQMYIVSRQTGTSSERFLIVFE